MAPCYRRFTLALRLKAEQATEILPTGADITTWLPGDNVYNSVLDVPKSIPPGEYEVGLALVDAQSTPRVRLAVEGRGGDGWYLMGKTRVKAAEKN